jgi:hypothetical protein
MGSFAIAFLFEPLDIQIFNADDIVFVDVHPGKPSLDTLNLDGGLLRKPWVLLLNQGRG